MNEAVGHGSPKRPHIVDVAARLFAVKGYAATSLQDIANELGILKGSVYHYISSKEELLYEAIVHFHERLRANMASTSAVEGPPLTRLWWFAHGHVSKTADVSAPFYREFRRLDADRQKRIVAERDEYEAFLKRILDEGQRDGSVCPEIDTKLATFGILGLVTSLSRWYVPEGPLDLETIASEFAGLAVGSVRCDPAVHEPGHRRQFTAVRAGTT